MNITIRVVCTDRGAHPERELAVIAPMPAQFDLADDAPPTLREVRRLGLYRVRGDRTRVKDGVHRVVKKSPVQLVPARSGDGSVLKTPPCPTCGRAPRPAVSTLSKAAEALAELADDPRRVTVDVSLLPA